MAFIVAIDGPAGSGKGTITKLVGKEMNLLNIDTGAMFRCITLEMIRNNVSVDDENGIKRILENSNIEFENDKNSDKIKVLLNGEDVSLAIRTEQVSNLVSPYSLVTIIREKLLKLQREIAKKQDVIMEGRDIGTVVFPNADVKIYLDASSEERAKRRVKQNHENGIESDYEKILKDIKERDKRDSTREVAPLKQAEDAIYIDTTNLTIEEVCMKIIDVIKQKRNK